MKSSDLKGNNKKSSQIKETRTDEVSADGLELTPHPDRDQIVGALKLIAESNDRIVGALKLVAEANQNLVHQLTAWNG